MTPQAAQNGFLDGLRVQARPALAAAVFAASLRGHGIRHHAVTATEGADGVLVLAAHVRRMPRLAVVEDVRRNLGVTRLEWVFAVDPWRTWRRHERDLRKDVVT